MLTTVAIVAFGYVAGSIPFAFLIAWWLGRVDLREVGSRNVGATNVFRVAGLSAAATTAVFDVAKGAAVVALARWMGASPGVCASAGAAAIGGHIYPVWLKFKGGKGVAVYIGVLFGLFWPAAVVFCVLWLATAATTRYSSLSALVASFITPIFLWWFGHPALSSLFAVLTLLLFYAHRENIKRLQAGTEGRIGEK